MAEEFTSYSVDNDRKFRNALAEASARMSDLTIPLTLITKDFFKSQRAIWKLKSPGQYPDLAESTKKDRRRRKQPIYPILKRTGVLERSMTNPQDRNALAIISNKKSLIIGTLVEYGVYHQSDRPRAKIPLRKFLFIGPESIRWAADKNMTGRLERWLGILSGFAKEKLKILGATS